MHRFACLFSVTALLAVACGGSPTGDDGGLDAAAVPDCTGQPDGTSCGDGRACMGGLCVAVGECGDGTVDDGEQCDDGNATAFDGCEPVTCTFTCEADGECDDGRECNGSEMCSADHVCAAGTAPAPGSACTMASGGDGVCRGADCVNAGCGNGVPDSGEDCDDGNTDSGDGCEPDCTFTCVDDMGCADDLFCNGDETCVVATHTCQPGADVTCTPSDACHTSTCSDLDAACVETLIDGDGDGEAATALGSCGIDCDDGNPERASGNTEICGNGIDDDCDAATSDAAMTLYYPDCDSDDYAAMGATGIAACMAPAACGGCSCTVRAATSVSNSDCADNSANAHPGQATYFSSAIPGEPASTDYDYNCDGVETRDVTCVSVSSSGSCPTRSTIWGCNPLVRCFPGPCCSTGGNGRGGWTSSSAPSCGSSASYTYCRDTGTTCVRTTVSRQQKCR